MAAMECNYSCQTASETLAWINAIIDFLRPYTFLINAHVVNFFKDRLWKDVDKEWIDCLSKEPIENLLLIPSGVVQDHWPISLKEFILKLRSMVFHRDQADLQAVLPGLRVISLTSVLAQGMNAKKRHEVEVLSAVVSFIANSVRAQTIVDVGAGQGYLAQVLSFQYQHPVVAIDACSHHGNVTDARAERIKKHYAAQMRKSRTFLECKDVKAVVSVGCCYNLLSEECTGDAGFQCGFPMSQAVRSTGLSLGKSARDLACQSAERWRSLEMHDGLHNFELHAFRAAFQMVLSKHYPEVMMSTPSIGRKGKALRRRHQRRIVESQLYLKEPMQSETADGIFCSAKETQALPCEMPSDVRGGCEGTKSYDKYSLFEDFCESALCHLGIKPSDDINFQGIWKEAEPFAELIGPYWSLRAALGPLLETLILLDRLLFLQEQDGALEVFLLPIFDPRLSPRNLAIIAKKIDSYL